MLNFLHSYFTKFSFEPIDQDTKPNEPSYTRNLDKLKKRAKDEAKPLIQRDQDGTTSQRHKPMTNNHGGDEEKKLIRVKVLMTKEEALRLISKCKEGGVFEFKDVAREVARIPSSRVTVVSLSAGNDDQLESIPEEP